MPLSSAPATVPQPASWQVDEPQLITGVSWPQREPVLHTRHVDTGGRQSIPLLSTRLAFAVIPGPAQCLGFVTFTDAGELRSHPCDRREPANRGTQCAACSARDEFRFAHHVHRGGYAPAGLKAYLTKPHRLYLATFADSTSKVGTVATHRGHRRLDEQGAVAASYLADTADGLTIRVLEDAISSTLGIPQTKRKTAKFKALSTPDATTDITTAHQQAVAEVTSLLTLDFSDQPAQYGQEPWPAPTCHRPILAPENLGGLAPYPHELTNGTHGFTAVAACGGTLAVHTRNDGPRYLVDFDRLKGIIVTPGDYRSPAVDVQDSLF